MNQDTKTKALNIIKEVGQLIRTGKVDSHCNGRCVAVFAATQLDGTEHIGWHYSPEDARAGDRFHFDHGVGIERNEDGQYLWVVPLLSTQIQDMISNPKKYDRKPITGLFTFNDRPSEFGTLKIDCCRIDLPPQVYFNNQNLSLDTLKTFSSISLLPSEHLAIWKKSSEYPKDGQEVITWDNDKVRANYSGPYWSKCSFDLSGKSNGRFQGYRGPMVSGLPWTSIKNWLSLDELFDITMGKYFSELVTV